MLESTHVNHSGLERRLAQLEALGLSRPANVLLAEYLRALTAQNVLDVPTADQVSAAYNRVRYSAATDDDPQVREAVAALDRVAEHLAALSPHDRQQIALRVCERIQSPAAEQPPEGDTERVAGAQKTPAPPSRAQQAARRNHLDRTIVESVVGAPTSSDELEAFVSTPTKANPQRSLRPRVSLELCVAAALATFFSGYFVRDSGNRIAEVGDDILSAPGSNPVSARDAWKDSELWANGVYFRAQEEAQSQRIGKARLALELALAYSPNNPSILNDLACVYLKPDEAGTTNPKRALQLAERALEVTRHAAILDTAAEAQFQCGNIQEAIRLESEALSKPSLWRAGSQFREYRQQKLQKFQDAEQIRTSGQATLTPNEPGTPGGQSADARLGIHLASGPSKPAGS